MIAKIKRGIILLKNASINDDDKNYFLFNILLNDDLSISIYNMNNSLNYESYYSPNENAAMDAYLLTRNKPVASRFRVDNPNVLNKLFENHCMDMNIFYEPKCQTWCNSNTVICDSIKDSIKNRGKEGCSQLGDNGMPDVFNTSECIEWCNIFKDECDEIKKQYCTSDKIISNDKCLTYCNENDCTDTLTNYCKNLTDDTANICGCFKPDTFYNTYISDLKNIFENIPNDTKGECLYQKCVNSKIPPKNCTTSLKNCIKSININNQGNITNKNNISIDANISDCVSTFKRRLEGGCDDDYVVAEDGVTCKKCGDNEIYNSTRTACEACGNDKIPNAEKTQCILNCTGNKIYNTDRTGCQECGGDSRPNADNTRCVVTCTDNKIYTSDLTACQECGPNSAPNTERTQCVLNCMGNKIYNTDRTACQECDENTLPNTNRTQCVSKKYSCNDNCKAGINGEYTSETECQEKCKKEEKQEKKNKGNRIMYIIGLILLLIIGGGFLYYKNTQNKSTNYKSIKSQKRIF